MTKLTGSCYFSFKEVKKIVEKWESEGLSKCMRQTCFSQCSIFFPCLVRHCCIGIYYQKKLCMILRTGNESSCELWQKHDVCYHDTGGRTRWLWCDFFYPVSAKSRECVKSRERTVLRIHFLDTSTLIFQLTRRIQKLSKHYMSFSVGFFFFPFHLHGVDEGDL